MNSHRVVPHTGFVTYPLDDSIKQKDEGKRETEVLDSDIEGRCMVHILKSILTLMPT